MYTRGAERRIYRRLLSLSLSFLRDIPKARFIDGLFTAGGSPERSSPSRESGANEACIHRARFARTGTGVARIVSDLLLLHAPVYERSSDVILVTNSDSPSRSPFFLLHSASSPVFFFFFGCRRCFVRAPCLSIFMLICSRHNIAAYLEELGCLSIIR